MDSRRDAIKHFAVGLAALAVAPVVGRAAPEVAPSEAGPILFKDGRTTGGRVGATCAIEPVHWSFVGHGGDGWNRQRVALDPPEGWYAATIALVSWQLRDARDEARDRPTGDGGIALSLVSPEAGRFAAEFNVLDLRHTGNDPFQGSFTALVTYYRAP